MVCSAYRYRADWSSTSDEQVSMRRLWKWVWRVKLKTHLKVRTRLFYNVKFAVKIKKLETPRTTTHIICSSAPCVDSGLLMMRDGVHGDDVLGRRDDAPFHSQHYQECLHAGVLLLSRRRGSARRMRASWLEAITPPASQISKRLLWNNSWQLVVSLQRHSPVTEHSPKVTEST